MGESKCLSVSYHVMRSNSQLGMSFDTGAVQFCCPLGHCAAAVIIWFPAHLVWILHSAPKHCAHLSSTGHHPQCPPNEPAAPAHFAHACAPLWSLHAPLTPRLPSAMSSSDALMAPCTGGDRRDERTRRRDVPAGALSDLQEASSRPLIISPPAAPPPPNAPYRSTLHS